MIQRNRQDFDPVLAQLSDEVGTDWLWHWKLASLGLDQYLPEAGHAQPEVIWTREYLTCPTGEGWVVRDRPQESVRIQKSLHSQNRSSISLGRGSLKSSGTINSPLAEP